MSAARDTELLADIACLLKKYGVEPFEALADKFKEGRLLDDLFRIIDASAKTGRRSSGTLGTKISPRKKKNGIAELLQRVEKIDTEKANILRQFHQNLVTKMILPTLRDMRHFAEDSGLQPIKATGRDKAILPLLRALEAVPVDRISYMVSEVPQFEAKGGRTLEGWTEVILGDRNKDAEGSPMIKEAANKESLLRKDHLEA